MKRIRSVAAILWLAGSVVSLRAELPVKRVLTLDAATKIAAAAEEEAIRRGSTVVICIVDDGGHLLVLHRLDDTQVASVEVGIGKARTAAIFRRPSKDFEDQIRTRSSTGAGWRDALAGRHSDRRRRKSYRRDRRQRQYSSGR